MDTVQFVAPCLFGLEALVAEELREMEITGVAAENGRVRFQGDESTLVRANLCSRYAERIQILMGTFPAHSFEELFQGVKALPWERWIGKQDMFPVKGWSIHSDLHSIPDCQAIIKKAVVERLKSQYQIDWFEETGPKRQIQFSIMKNTVSIMIDTSGAGLHKRGYRPAANDAPIKETLAAAMAKLARLRDFHTLYDPFCGSGTILIEGAMLAHNIMPGLKRSFSAERWSQIDESIWQEERRRAIALIKKDSDFKAYGSDIDPRSIELAQINAKRAGISSKIEFEVADIKDFKRKSERGTVICNPPYGERMLDIRQAEDLFRTMGRVFAKERGWTYSIINPNEDFEKQFGRRADKRRKLYNGMIQCQLYMYYK